MPKDELRCPLCQELIHQRIGLKGAEDIVANWYLCRCGFMFHAEKHQPEEYFNEEYKIKFEGIKKIEERQMYYLRCFAPIIEEKVYGRRFLDVGFGSPFILEEMERRGWLSCGIDIIEHKGYIKADFFKEKFEGEKFDCIWLSDFLQSTTRPVEAVYKAIELLRPGGILFIVTPNTDLLKRDVIPSWGHWDMQYNYSFINERILKECFLKFTKGFNERMDIIYSDWSNQSNRFTTWNNMIVISQKTAIIDNPAYERPDDAEIGENNKPIDSKIPNS